MIRYTQLTLTRQIFSKTLLPTSGSTLFGGHTSTIQKKRAFPALITHQNREFSSYFTAFQEKVFGKYESYIEDKFYREYLTYTEKYPDDFQAFDVFFRTLWKNQQFINSVDDLVLLQKRIMAEKKPDNIETSMVRENFVGKIIELSRTVPTFNFSNLIVLNEFLQLCQEFNYYQSAHISHLSVIMRSAHNCLSNSEDEDFLVFCELFSKINYRPRGPNVPNYAKFTEKIANHSAQIYQKGKSLPERIDRLVVLDALSVMSFPLTISNKSFESFLDLAVKDLQEYWNNYGLDTKEKVFNKTFTLIRFLAMVDGPFRQPLSPLLQNFVQHCQKENLKFDLHQHLIPITHSVLLVSNPRNKQLLASKLFPLMVVDPHNRQINFHPKEIASLAQLFTDRVLPVNTVIDIIRTLMEPNATIEIDSKNSIRLHAQEEALVNPNAEEDASETSEKPSTKISVDVGHRLGMGSVENFLWRLIVQTGEHLSWRGVLLYYILYQRHYWKSRISDAAAVELKSALYYCTSTKFNVLKHSDSFDTIMEVRACTPIYQFVQWISLMPLLLRESLFHSLAHTKKYRVTGRSLSVFIDALTGKARFNLFQRKEADKMVNAVMSNALKADVLSYDEIEKTSIKLIYSRLSLLSYYSQLRIRLRRKIMAEKDVELVLWAYLLALFGARFDKSVATRAMQYFFGKQLIRVDEPFKLLNLLFISNLDEDVDSSDMLALIRFIETQWKAKALPVYKGKNPEATRRFLETFIVLLQCFESDHVSKLSQPDAEDVRRLKTELVSAISKFPHARPDSTSNFELDVLNIVRKAFPKHKISHGEYLLEGTIECDIIIRNKDSSEILAIVECHGPSHFSVGRYEQLFSTSELRCRLKRKLAKSLILIPDFEWIELSDQEQKLGYIRAKVGLHIREG